MTIVANSLLLVTFLVDPLKIFRNPTSYFLIGLAIVDLLTALIQEPIYATCFMLMYFQHPSWTKCKILDEIYSVFFGISNLNIGIYHFCLYIDAVYRGGIASEVRPHDYKEESLT